MDLSRGEALERLINTTSVERERLTEIRGKCVEDAQTNKLLGDLGPSRNEESDEVTPLENGPEPLLGISFRDDTLRLDGRSHNTLKMPM